VAARYAAYVTYVTFVAYVTETKYLLCKLCNFSGKVNKKSVLVQHGQSARHKKNLELHNKGEKFRWCSTVPTTVTASSMLSW